MTEWNIDEIPNLLKRIFRQTLRRECAPTELITYGCQLSRGEITIKDIIKEKLLSEEYEDIFIEPFNEDEIPFEKDILQHGMWIYLQSNNGYYVCAENGGGTVLIANRYKPLGWETFTIEKKDKSNEKIRADDEILLKASNGKYVAAPLFGVDSKLIANFDYNSANNAFTGGCFTIEKSDGAPGEIGDGDKIKIKSKNGQYVYISSKDQCLYAKKDSIPKNNEFTINIQYLK